jgi:ankyrin repeat protein
MSTGPLVCTRSGCQHINAKDQDNKALLMGAPETGDVEPVKFLLSKGADGNVKRFRDMTALNFVNT